jgi:hypothetical protein
VADAIASGVTRDHERLSKRSYMALSKATRSSPGTTRTNFGGGGTSETGDDIVAHLKSEFALHEFEASKLRIVANAVAHNVSFPSRTA